jgi:hypothetical protein
MINNQIATLPKDPNDPWNAFSDYYTSLPVHTSEAGRTKKVEANSSLLPGGVVISSTFTETEEIGRVIFSAADRDSIHPDLAASLLGWGWKFLRKGTKHFVFLKSLELQNGKSTMPLALPLILRGLGVDPRQDWAA